jgi:hypothetical protein
MFLISTAWQYRMGARPSSFAMPLPWFVPVSFVSGLTSLAIQLVKIGAYAVFGVLHWRLARHGLTAGAGAIAAIWLVNPWLRHLSSFRFRQFAVFVMLFGGLLILWQQRALVTALLGVG